MDVCTICGEQYCCRFNELGETEEPCACGEMCDCNPWKWDRWQGIRKFLVYRLGYAFYKMGSSIIDLEERSK